MENDVIKKRKDLALEMAQFLYDIYKEQQADIIEDGQNDAQKISSI